LSKDFITSAAADVRTMPAGISNPAATAALATAAAAAAFAAKYGCLKGTGLTAAAGTAEAADVNTEALREDMFWL
jgi:hypothetical protein